MINGLKSIRRERASLERERVLIGSMLESAMVSDMLVGDVMFEDVSEDELEELIERIPESDSEDSEIDRVADSDEDLDIDAILGVNPEIPEGGIDDESECCK